MKIMRNIFLAVALLLASATAQAIETKEPAVWASVDKGAAFIGDKVKYQLEVSTEKGVEIKFPKFADGKIGDLEIKDSGSEVKKGIFGKIIFINWYNIAAYAPGKYTIPRIEIKYKQSSAKDWTVVKGNTVDITVRSLIPSFGVKDIRDIKGPFYIFEINWFVIAAAVIIIVASVFIFILYNKKRSTSPIRLPHETALEELEAIKGTYARGGGVKEYYVGISDCVRRYIERVFRLKAPEMTTEEFLDSMKGSGALSPQQKGLLKDFLNACDLVKFAKYAPSRVEIEAVPLSAQKFIEETKDVHI